MLVLLQQVGYFLMVLNFAGINFREWRPLKKLASYKLSQLDEMLVKFFIVVNF